MSHHRHLRASLEKCMKKHASSVAVQETNGIVTYSELHVSILDYMVQLQSHRIHPGSRVLIYGIKSIDMLVAMLACIFSGITYIPVEKPMPDARILSILQNTKATARIDVGLGITKTQYSSSPSNDSLIFYTSGSTGSPKGIRITDQNILSFANWARKQFNMTCSDRICGFAPWHFDLSILDIFATLLSGAALYCIPTQIKSFPYRVSQWLNHNKISLMYMVPTAIRHLIKHGKWTQASHADLRCLLFAGEVYPLLELKQLRQAFPKPIIVNLYGPTETNVCTWQTVPSLSQLEQW